MQKNPQQVYFKCDGGGQPQKTISIGRGEGAQYALSPRVKTDITEQIYNNLLNTQIANSPLLFLPT